MSISSLERLLRYFGTSAISEENRQDLKKEALLMTLAHAANADSNIQSVEVDAIQTIYHAHTGDKVSESEIRVLARSDLFKSTTLMQYLNTVQRRMDMEDKRDLVNALIEVFKSDESVSPSEARFFNKVVDALNLTCADVVGL